MNTNADKRTEHDEIEMLLPWYVTGKLDAADLRRVEAYLARHPEMQRRVEASFADRSETVFLNQPRPRPSAAVIDQFMAEIAQRKPSQMPTAGRRPWSENLRAWMKRNLMAPAHGPTAMHWSGLAVAALIILVQAATITVLFTSRQEAVYHTASEGAQPSLRDSYVVIRFVDDVPAAKIVQAMSELDMMIVAGPKAGGLFTVRIGPADMSDADRKQQISMLQERRDLVLFVMPIQ